VSLSMHLPAGSGILTVHGPNGPTVTGQGTSDLTIVGTVDQLNADLADDINLPQAIAGAIAGLVGKLVYDVYLVPAANALSAAGLLAAQAAAASALAAEAAMQIAARAAFQAAGRALLPYLAANIISRTNYCPHFVTADGLVY